MEKLKLVKFHGRSIDGVALWSRYVEFPPNMKWDAETVFLPKVRCPNPSHDTWKSHFQINLRDGLVHCFTYCGISGTFEHAICVIEGLYEKYNVEGASDERERKRRVRRARREAGKIILKGNFQTRKRLSKLPVRSSHATEIVRPVDALDYATFLPKVGQEFLSERHITSESMAKWRLGWDPTEARLVIPAHDENDVLRFLIKRAVRPKDQPKYLYTQGVPKTSLLFGACALDLGMVKSAGMVLVEGSLDTIICHQNGLQNTGGILGTGISDAQVKIIARMRPRRIYFMFDKDTAGITNIEIACRKLRKFPLYICRYPKGKYDPAELNREEAQRSISNAVPAMTWLRENYPNATRQKGQQVG
jgi:DNA primase